MTMIGSPIQAFALLFTLPEADLLSIHGAIGNHLKLRASVESQERKQLGESQQVMTKLLGAGMLTEPKAFGSKGKKNQEDILAYLCANGTTRPVTLATQLQISSGDMGNAGTKLRRDGKIRSTVFGWALV